MAPFPLNYPIIFLSAIASMLVGFIWYGPLFGKTWIKLMGWANRDMDKMKKDMNMTKTYGLSFIAALVTSYVLSLLVNYMGAADYFMGVQVGFWVWLGFIGPVQLTDLLFGSKSFKLFLINTGYQLTSVVIMGAILARWV